MLPGRVPENKKDSCGAEASQLSFLVNYPEVSERHYYGLVETIKIDKVSGIVCFIAAPPDTAICVNRSYARVQKCGFGNAFRTRQGLATGTDTDTINAKEAVIFPELIQNNGGSLLIGNCLWMGNTVTLGVRGKPFYPVVCYFGRTVKTGAAATCSLCYIGRRLA